MSRHLRMDYFTLCTHVVKSEFPRIVKTRGGLKVRNRMHRTRQPAVKKQTEAKALPLPATIAQKNASSSGFPVCGSELGCLLTGKCPMSQLVRRALALQQNHSADKRTSLDVLVAIVRRA